MPAPSEGLQAPASRTGKPDRASAAAQAAAALAVTIDLIAEDEAIRAALPEPQTVRIPQREEKDETGKVTREAGEAVVTIPPASWWPLEAMRYAMQELWILWARSVLSEEDFEAWQRAGIRTAQMKRIYDAVTAAEGADAGK